jgi:thiamine biosynthesis lipoprotein
VHHLIDPRIGAPASGTLRTVSVAASTCTLANAASTAAVILGDDAPRWLAERELPARLVSRDGEVRYVAGWPEPGKCDA